jgi:hypothetical protein
MTSGTDGREFGFDQLDPAETGARPRFGWLPYRRLTLGGRATATPTLLYVLAGVALGPYGLNILSDAVVIRSQGLTWVGLAVTGVFVGLGLASRGIVRGPRITLASVIIAVTTVGAIAAGLYVLSSHSRLPLTGHLAAGAILVALCASASASIPTSEGASREVLHAAFLADIDDIPLVFGGMLLVAMLTGDAAALRAGATLGAGGAIGLAGCLLFARASATERGLFVTGAVLLLAGTGTYLGTSPLASGCAAAVVWWRVPGTADRITAEDLRVLQHPLVVLIMIFAGAAAQVTLAVLWVGAITIVLRLAAKVLASVIVSRLTTASPSLLASVLLQPGVLGAGLAMNAWLLLGDDYRWVLSAVLMVTVVSEGLALLQPHVAEATS